MSNDFSRTLRSLSGAGSSINRWATLAAALIGVSMIGWLGWGETTSYAATEKARVEVESAAHPIQPEIAGVVVKSALRLGQSGAEGDVMVALDSEAFRIQLCGDQTRLETAEVSLSSLQRELDAERGALDVSREAASASRVAALAKGEAADTARDFAK